MLDDDRHKDRRPYLPGDFRAEVYPFDFHGPVLENLSGFGRPTDLQVVEFKQYLRCQLCGLPCAGTCVDEAEEVEEVPTDAQPTPDATPTGPERVDPPYRAFAIAKDGTRSAINAREIVIELEPGIEVELDLAPHPSLAATLPVHVRKFEGLRTGGLSISTLSPGAASTVHLHVRHPGKDGEGEAQGEAPTGKGP